MKKLRSLVAAVVAVACLYTPTAAAEPNVFENLGTDSMSQVNDPSDVEESLGPEGSEDEADAASGNDGEPTGESGDTAQPNAGDNGVPSGSEGNEVHSGEGDGANMLPEGESGTGDTEQSESEATTPEEGEDETTPETEAPQPVAQDWTDDADNLTFSTTGLTITPDQTVAGSESDGSRSDQDEADIAGMSVIPDGLNGTDVVRGQLDETPLTSGLLAAAVPTNGDAEGNADVQESGEWTTAQLPETIEATLNLTFVLDAAAGEGRADGSGAGVIVSGDTFSAALPEGIEAADDGTTIDVFACDAEGNRTTTRVAEGKVSGGTLTVTFAEPIDTATGEPMDAMASVRASIDLPVRMGASLVKDEAGTVDWTVRQVRDAAQDMTADSSDANNTDAGNDAAVAGDGTRPDVLQLPIPAKSDVLNALGLTGTEDADKTVQPKSDSDKNSGSTSEALANEANAVAGTTTETKAGPFDTQVSSQTIWCDNNSGNRPLPESLGGGYIPQYLLDAGQTYRDLVDASGKVTEQAKTDLHLTPEDAARIEGSDLIQITRSATNTYSVITSALPSKIVKTIKSPVLDEKDDPTFNEDGSQKFHTEEVNTPIKWQLKDTNTYPGYVSGSNSTWEKQYKMLTTDISFNVVGKVGDKKLRDIFGQDQAEDFQFGASINNKDQGSISVAEAVDKGWVTITDTDDGCTITGTLPMYDEQGYPIVYYVKYTGADSGADYYQASYDNSASASHGSANDAVYPGGTMTLRHAGTTTFNGTKVWLDGDNHANRPAVTYTLWRYSTQGSPATASQVSVASLNSENPDAPAPNVVGFVEVTAPADSGKIVLHQLLADEYGKDLIDSLPKYDPDGYPYIYCMREEPISGYEQVFGSVDENGNVSDTKPRYQNEDGTGWIDVNRESRPDTDRFVYNGGTLSNRLTGTTSTQMTKTWEIAAFQDSLQNVVCEFTAQSRVKSSDDEAAWQNVNASNAVQALTSWNAETLTKTVSESFPKYDAHGNELEYRWIESNVTIDGRDTGFTQNADGTASFTVNLTNSEGATEELQFTSTPETVKNDDGSFATTIVNTFENVTDQHVDKYWEQADGTLAQIAPDPAYSDGDATVQLFQDGVLIGDFTMDGKTDPDVYDIDGLEGATWQETRSYHIDFEGLPKYSADGKRYTYLVIETNKAGWDSERTYDPKTRTTRINNYFPEGEGSEIRVTKKWIDGDDAEHRYKVEVTLYAARDMESQAKDADGNPLHSYKQGDPVMEGIELSEGEQWFTEVDVPIGGLTYKDFYAQETALIADDGTRYPVVTIDEAKAQYPNEDWVNAGWTNPDNRRVATPEHVYEVRYQENSTLQSLEVTNRRLGLFDLTVTKTWNDALGADEDGTRPAATLTLSCDEYPEAFSLDENGNLQVSVSGNILPVTVTDEAGSAIKVTIVDTDGNSADKGSARIQVDTTKQSATYQFEGMPKYDANGMNVHYSVNETWDSTDHGDYYSTKTVGEYVVEPNKRHFEDHQQVDFANNRSGTRDVVFYKEWHDNYVSEELNQRPDIYLTLYRTSANQTEPEAVPGYIHFNWSALAEEGDAANEQKVTISDLPKYDSKGAEYIYYASEAMSADGTSLGYTDVQFNYDSIEEADAQAEAEAKGALVAQGAENAVKVGDTAGDNPEENGTGWAIREDGTFVNRLGGNLTAQGTKLWENVPGIVSQVSTDDSAQGDLPAVTIYLQQKLTSTVKWPDAFATQKADGTWEVSGTVASASELKQVTTNQYTYTIDKDYQGDPLPRYDEKGNRFEYRAIEIMWGLLDQPGGFTADDLKGVNLAEVRDDDGAALVGAVYVIQHGETGSFLLRNVYGGNEKGKLTVKKLVAGLDQGDEYPDVTFEVYRYYKGYKGDANESSPAELVAPPQTISGKDFSSGQATITFDNLDVYAPDGSRWIYFVAERSIGGYTTTVGTGDIDSVPDKHLVSGQMIDGAGVVVEEGGVAIRSEDLGNADETAIHDDKKVDVTFANAYEPGSTSLNGTKKWSDYDNIFSVRPGAINLTFTRTAGGMAEDVATQSNDPGAANYLKWTAQGTTGDWTFTLSNIEQWAPNGQAWEYHVNEALSDDGLNHYTIVTGTSSATAGTSDSFTLENALNGKATVEKNWVDGDDPYGLRPTSVTVRLQARVTYDDNSPDANGWADAYTLFNNAGYHLDGLVDQAGNQITESWFEKTLNAGNGWRGSWTGLPRGGKSKDPQKGYFTLEYRVVETKIGDQVIATPDEQPHATATDENKGNIYKTVHPYQPTQSDSGNAQDGFQSTITNTLEGTKITAEKRWSDVDNAWDTRPGGTNWAVTYLLQRRVPEDNWEWVTHYGTTHNEGENLFDPDIVTRTITSADATAEWDNLPATDTDGNAYSYRVVERVPGGYDVLQSENRSPQQVAEETILDGEHAVTYRYYAVDNDLVNGAFNDNQTYTNVLRTTELKGTKRWEDYGTGLADKLTVNDMPKLTLWRKAGDNGQAVQVTYIETTTNSDGTVIVDKNADGQPKWTKNGDDFTFTYTGLPAANGDDVPYTYWATETAGDAPGYYPLYGEGEELTSTPDESSVITNTATRFTLDKVSDDWYPATEGNQQVPVNDVELTLSKDSKTFAVWRRDASGTVTSFVWPAGTEPAKEGEQLATDNDSLEATNGFAMTGTNAGYIISLPAGTYTVTETKTPKGFAQARPVTITIAANGAVTASGDGLDSVDTVSGVADAAGTAMVKVTVEDQILRGHLQLTKYLSADGNASGSLYSDATFDLYSVDLDGDVKPELIASDLKPVNGVLTTVGNSAKINTTSSSSDPEEQVDLTHGGRYITLADGLPEGKYFFHETGVGPDAVKPGTSGTKVETDSDHLTITQDNHFAFTSKAVATKKGNEAFSATVTLPKYDCTSTEGIEDASFELRYRPEGSTADPETVKDTDETPNTFETDEQGLLTLLNLEKGDYQLVEVANAGYEVPADGRVIATFTLDDADDDGKFDMTKDADRTAIDFQTVGGTFDNDGTYNKGDAVTNPAGIPNDRLTGSIAIDKTGMDPQTGEVGALNGATFTLEVRDGDGWTPIATGLKTGNTYAMAYDDDGSYAFNDAGTPGTNGRITVTNLTWGTYHFVETASTAGHIDPEAMEKNTSDPIVIDRYTLNPAATGDNQVVTMANEPTQFEIVKVAPDGTTKLAGAEFLVSADQGDTFADRTTEKALITDDSGKDTLTGQLVVGGTYMLKETKAPGNEYDLLDGTVTFTVEEDGTLAVQGDLPEGYAQTDADGDGKPDNGFSFTATDSYFELYLQKTGDTSSITGSAEEHPFAGAQFILYGIPGKAPIMTADADGRIAVHEELAKSNLKLQSGVSYWLVESHVPDGFIDADDFELHFHLDERGNIVVEESTENRGVYTIDNGTVTITVENQPTDLTIAKRAEDGTTPLGGAEFTITPEDSEDDRFVDGAESHTLTTSTDGTASLVGQLIVRNNYIIEEIKAPAGYTKIDGHVTIRVAADGTLYILKNRDGSPTPDVFMVTEAGMDVLSPTITNNPTELVLKKLDADTNQPIAGVKFTLAGDFADDSDERTLVTEGDLDGVALDRALLIADGETEYTLHEVEPPAGYETIQTDLTFTVETDGSITVKNADAATAAGWGAVEGGFTLTAHDDPIEIGLAKTDLDGKEIEGADAAQFVVKAYDANSHFVGETPDEVVNGITVTPENARDRLHGRLIAGNVYTITETVAPAGYEVIADPLTFSVNADGTVAEQSGPANRWSVGTGTGDESDVAIITAADRPVEIVLVKNGDDGAKNLNGAVFDLYEGNTVTGDLYLTVTTQNGSATIDYLTAGKTYTLVERTAPAGYELMTEPVTFTVDTDGKIAFTNETAAANAGYAQSHDDGTGVVTITAVDQLIEITLNKEDLGGNPLSGAEFTLEGEFSDTTDESKPLTFEGSSYTFSGLIAGEEYTLTETKAPEGYELIADGFTFTVNTDGTIKPADDAEGYRIEDGNIITAQDTPIEVELKKQSENGKALAGAVFNVTPADGFTFADGSTEAQTITIESTSGATALTNLTANMTYILKETVPPAGYELNETEFTFTVAADGTIVSAEADGYTVSGSEIITITVNDEPIEVTLTKQDADGAALEGAEFTLHGMFANADGTPSGTVADRTVVVENGTVALEGLIADQQYTLTETKAPEGYRVNTGTLTFTVNTDGTLTEVEPAEGYAIDAETGTAIAVTDQPTELDLTKLAADGTPLAGAEFTLAPDTERDADSRFVSDRSSIDLVIGEDGTVPTVTGELIAGHAYVLTETKAPDGYALITESLHFTVGRKGRAASVTAGTELPDGYTIGGDKTAGTIALTAVDQPIELTLKKVNEDGDVLVGAEFTLSGRFADGTTQQILTTGADGTAALPLIIGGERYVLEETKAPEGYVLPAERYTFTVGVDGVIHVQQNPLAALLPGDKTFSLSEDGLTITVVNEREPVVAITGSDVTSVGFIGFGLLLIGATIAMQRRTRMAQVAGNGKPARGRHRR